MTSDTEAKPLALELLDCPFCGGSVELEKTIGDCRPWWGVVCRNTKNVGGTCAIQQRPSATPEAAATRWNTRANPSSIRNAALDEAVMIIQNLMYPYDPSRKRDAAYNNACIHAEQAIIGLKDQS